MKPNEKIIKKCEKMIKRCFLMTLTTIDDKGVPNTREMLKAGLDGMDKIWFTTNTSSRKVGEISKNENACVYIFSRIPFQGITIQGRIKIIDDMEKKKKIWKKAYYEYYKKGVEDPDYTVLLFEIDNIVYYCNQKTYRIK